MMGQYIIPAVATIIVAIIEAIAARERKEIRTQSKREVEVKLLQLQMIDATMQLSIVTANALTGGHNNGNVEAARQAAQAAGEAYSDYIKKFSIETLYGNGT